MRGRLRGLLAVVLSCAMALSTFPTEALAVVELGEGDIEYTGQGDNKKVSKIKIDPYTLNCWDDKINGDELTIDNLGVVADELSKMWAPIAGAIYDDNSPVTINSRKNKTRWNEWYGPDVENGDPSDAGSVDVIDALMGRSELNEHDEDDTGEDRYNRSGEWRGRDNDDTYMTSGLQYAVSMDDILREMCDMSGAAYAGDEINDHDLYINHRAERSAKLYELAGEDGAGLSWMKDDAEAGSAHAFYRIVSSQDEDGDRYFSNNYALIFYDFQLTAVGLDEEVGASRLEEYTADDDSTKASTEFVENRSQRDQQESFTLSNSTEETVSSSYSHSKTITHGIDAGVNVEFEHDANVAAGTAKWSQKIGFHFSTNWSKAIQTAHSKEESISNSTSTSSTTSVTIPPHTAIAFEKSKGIVAKTLSFNCPTVLNYKVAIVSLCWKPGAKNDVKTFSARFGCGVQDGGVHATQNLYMRALNASTKNKIERAYGQVAGAYEEDHISVSGIDWDKIVEKTYSEGTNGWDGNIASKIQAAATQLPMFTAGMSMTVTTTTNTSSLGNIQPLFQLKEVKLTEGNKRYSMIVGDSLSLANLKVDGYNEYGVDYYGFQPDKGEWVLCDGLGNQLDASDVIEIDYDEATGTMEVVAKAEGQAYLMWVLDNNVTYKAKEGLEVTRSNPHGLITPIVRVTVNKPVTDLTGYQIEAEGEPTIIVGEQLDLNNAFNAAVIDASDRIVTHSVKYEARDNSENSPVSVDENGIFTAEKKGDYKVRATYTLPNAKDGAVVNSDWLIVHVADRPEASVDPVELTADGGEAKVILSGQYLGEGIEVKLTGTDGSELKAQTTGTGTEQVATFNIPANTTFNVDKVYSVSCVMGGENVAEGMTVTVKANTLTKHDAVEATCDEDGSVAYWECDQTGKLYRDENGTEEITAENVTVKALGHELTKHEAVSATCETDGNIEYWECSRCHTAFADEACRNPVDLADVVVPATGHAWGDWDVTTPATEEAPGVETRTCGNEGCGATETRTIDILEHTHDLVKTEAVAATCENPGNIEYWTCTKCGDIFADEAGTQPITIDDTVIQPTGHSFGEWMETRPATEDAEGEETRACNNPGCEYKETRTIPTKTHTHDLQKIDASAATCTQDGNIDYWLCTSCGRLFTDIAATTEVNVEDAVVPATGHKWDNGTETTAAGCTTRGVMTFHCTNAGCTEEKTVSIPATGHDWGEGVATKQPGCTTNGEREYTCANGCGSTKTEPIEAIGHKWPEEGTVTTEPTCTAKGVRTYTCENELTHTKQESIPALGHDWGEGVVTTEPTCTAKGEETFTCKNDPTHTMTKPIDAINHDWDEGVVTTEPTCTTKGVRTYTCKNDPTHTMTKPIDAINHDWDEGVVTAEPTCTDKGKKTFTCKNDPTHTKTVAIDALGHDWDEGAVTTAPTCTGKGVRTFTCKNDPTHTKTAPIDALGHEWDEGEVTTAPTCITKGVRTYTCKNDSTHTKTKAIAATGHDWDAGKVTKKPTCNAEGTKTYTCKNDPTHTKTESIEALGHEWDEGEITTAPTCTAKGVRTYTCKHDATHTKTKAVAATGHNWSAPTYKWSKDYSSVTATRTCQNDPSHVQTETVETTKKVNQKATCTTAGKATYTATFSNAAFKKQTKTQTLAKLGHKWGTTTYTWSKDLSTCTAKHVCTRDKSHVQTAKAKVTSKVTKKPTATKAGVRTYTATFDASWAKKQTKTASIAATGTPTVSALGHVSNVGWMNRVSGGKVVGIPGHSRRLEALELTLQGAPVSGGIEYRSHVQDTGWEKSWSRNGKMSGTTGQSKRIEALQVRLYGKMAEQYDVYYRVYSQNYGWMGWAKNGAKAGTQSKKLRVEAIQVTLVKKGGKAPSAVFQGAKQAYSKVFVK
ncbi:MAG: Ig domain-containing protein [Atopobiaceae bacterium]|nr:Ig domain-containing protein [Atopobiaceae bacterium]